MSVEQKIENGSDKFPVGMRVLAVDDDPACLKLLETLLRKCQYHVTTTSQAVLALKMLRENKNKFDLVISDVCMPDMDGFKLLELVGLEMDLPVIMLSAYGDTENVMKGITHGACDYLLKPVRLEALKNIWQHVIRRKNVDPKDHNNINKHHGETGDPDQNGFIGTSDPDQNGKLNKKRKDQNDDEDNEHDEDNNGDPSTQKKPRVVWSGELHRKFVAAVNQLGFEKAVPKSILQMMNVKKLTRENVASHLQKYRLYLKRISCVANQQANMVAAMGRADSAYSQMGYMNAFGNLHNLAGSSHFENAAFRSFPPSSVLSRLNSPSGLGMLDLSSSGMIQAGHVQNSMDPINGVINFDSLTQPENQNVNILQGVPLSIEPDQLQHSQNVACSSSYSLFSIQNNPVKVEEHLQAMQRGRAFENQSSSQLLDFERCNDSWPRVVQSFQLQSSSYAMNDCFQHITPSDMRDNSSVSMHVGISRTDLQSEAAFSSSNGLENMSFGPKKEWDDLTQYASNQSNISYSSMHSSTAAHDYHVVQMKPQGNNAHNSVSSMEDLVAVMMKEDQGKLISREGYFGCDTHSHSSGNCIST